jgi:hypothetical protein
MKTVKALAVLGTLLLASPVSAHDTEMAFPTRGACESASAGMSNVEKDWLVATFPDLFDTAGEAASFLTKAWTCDLKADGQYYIVGHIDEILASRWYQQRNH